MARIAEARERGQLSIVTGRVTATEADETGVTATVRLRGSGDSITLQAARLIDCTGLNGDCAGIDQPLLKQLLAEGLVRPDPLRLGLDVTAEGAVTDHAGQPAPDLFAIGPITRGAFWEIVAVPDLRVACEAMAERLLADRPAQQRAVV
jgi:uncharacterized NAD(P)/FAD-binding protein YdhS